MTKIVGRTKALEWLWTGDRIPVDIAFRIRDCESYCIRGIINGRNHEVCQKDCQTTSLSLRLIKDSVNKAVDYSLYEGMQYERKNFYLLFSSQDQKEGMQAFMEKRKPNFKGK